MAPLREVPVQLLAGGKKRFPQQDPEVLRAVAGGGVTVRNESAAPAQALAVLSPGADMERFARAVAELPHDAEGTAIDAVIRLAAASGIESTRPLAELG